MQESSAGREWLGVGMTTLLLNPPYKKVEWFDLSFKDFATNQKWCKYLYDYGRAVSLSNQSRLTELTVAAGVDKDKVADHRDIRKMVSLRELSMNLCPR